MQYMGCIIVLHYRASQFPFNLEMAGWKIESIILVGPFILRIFVWPQALGKQYLDSRNVIMLIHSYRVCLLFSHGEAVLIPADKHVIYIFSFKFWMKPFPAFVSAVHFCPSIIVKRHNHLIVIL